jgi:hypothetical protein
MAAREGQSAYSMKLVGSGALATGLAVLSTVEWVVVARAGARERPLPLCPSKHSLRWVLAVGQSLWAQLSARRAHGREGGAECLQYEVGWQRSIGHRPGCAVHGRVSSGGAGGRERAAAAAVPIEALTALGTCPMWASPCGRRRAAACPFVRLFFVWVQSRSIRIAMRWRRD